MPGREEVPERFRLELIRGARGDKDLHPHPQGEWVSYPDYAKLETALVEAEDRFVSCDHCERPSREEDLKTIWCREPESGEQVDARICLVCRLEAERDEAANQERQRIQEALEGLVERQELNSQDCGPVIPVGSIEAFIEDTLDPSGEEDADDLCTCGHERFHHDDGREMGILTHCKAKACTCKQFRISDPSREQGEENGTARNVSNAVGAIADELRAHPEVRWDRLIEFGGKVRVYGWLDRADNRCDFLLLDFDAASGELREWITSAHPHPASVVERLEDDQSVECQRVEDHFEIPNAVRLGQVPDQPKAGNEWPEEVLLLSHGGELFVVGDGSRRRNVRRYVSATDPSKECYSCGEPASGKCPKSKRPCGHHCNCSWVHDRCHWCGKEFGEAAETAKDDSRLQELLEYCKQEARGLGNRREANAFQLIADRIHQLQANEEGNA